MAGLITATLTFDKPVYNPGDPIIATIVRHAVGAATVENDPVSGVLKDAAGDDVTVSGSVQINHPGGAVASTVTSLASATRTFTELSDDGTTWTGKATA